MVTTALAGRGTPAVARGVGHGLPPVRHFDSWPAGVPGTRLVVIGAALDGGAIRSGWDTPPEDAPRPLPAARAGRARRVGPGPSAGEGVR